MNRKLAKISVGTIYGTSLLFGLSQIPAFAVNLCPTLFSGTGTIPGCGGVNVVTGISSVISILLFVSFLIALIFLIIGGIRWIMSGGDKEGTNKAKETVTSALIGLAVVLGAFVLINLVIGFLTGGNLSNVNNSSFTLNVGP